MATRAELDLMAGLVDALYFGESKEITVTKAKKRLKTALELLEKHPPRQKLIDLANHIAAESPK